MQLVNLTLYALALPDGRTLPPARHPAFVHATTHVAGEIAGIPLYALTRAVHDLPDPEPETLYIVTQEVREHLPGRTDVASPRGNLNCGIVTVTHLIVNP